MSPEAQPAVSAAWRKKRFSLLNHEPFTIVAEGVETQEEFALAKAAGCNRFQGYFFGRPAPRDKAPFRAIDAEPLALSA
ncbi:EAL domain-containing protein [Mesorhizobium sp. WSM4307]|nr:hypothetical protein CK232_19550 [Mesorhizobium sp. WSM4304]PBB74281.1 hypothetical protein CK227_16510 [Mesorhizobium sp. WSM4308]PBC21169.1 hypothetical protein CK226_20155 [Mesorhizobium sp. WSM4311]TRC75643.1 EAL domain-containing protein [Mesorhizobium sp. WSM4315]TRC79399.1 EAL domain-containing protein [Mesorhizobium sp. WSM4310]TRC86346.1 EAL domain-containing protein [Mesorhizobium sp. WSM4307]TRC99399.1 EAL domain-containing protein [Mesorhizobium sp. WSM4305]